jgi:RNA polymerase sigma factor (sigma-70 family)
MLPNITVHRAKKGDMQARATLYEQYSKPMYNLCIKLLGNIQDAEDVLQDSFITAFAKVEQLKEDALFGGWLKRIVVNNCFVQLKNKQTNFIYYTDEVLDEPIEKEEQYPNITPQDINKGIAELPNGCKQILVLYLLENYSHKEIAGLLKISESTSKSQYQYGKKLLKNCLHKIMYKNEL